MEGKVKAKERAEEKDRQKKRWSNEKKNRDIIAHDDADLFAVTRRNSLCFIKRESHFAGF
jgi:hypothetical protein